MQVTRLVQAKQQKIPLLNDGDLVTPCDAKVDINCRALKSRSRDLVNNDAFQVVFDES
jgi:hypothetical protein